MLGPTPNSSSFLSRAHDALAGSDLSPDAFSSAALCQWGVHLRLSKCGGAASHEGADQGADTSRRSAQRRPISATTTIAIEIAITIEPTAITSVTARVCARPYRGTPDRSGTRLRPQSPVIRWAVGRL